MGVRTVVNSSVGFICGWGGMYRSEDNLEESLSQYGSWGLNSSWQPETLPAELFCKHWNLVLHLTAVKGPRSDNLF